MKRYIPINVHFNHALIQRLPSNHHKIPHIEKDTRKFMSGYRGELATDYHLQFLEDKNHHIFRSLRLPYKEQYFQIDTLILSRQYILLLETKNHSGHIDIDQEQFTRKSVYGEQGYHHPINQVNEQKERLKEWLAQHRLPEVPIIPLVILSHSSAIIKSTQPDILRSICKSDNMRNKIPALTKDFQENLISTRMLKKIANLLLKENTPFYPQLERTYGMSKEDLIRGVQCPECAGYHMLRKDRVWVCPHCLYHSRDAFYDSLLDYFLLIKPTITNKEFRDFFGIDSMKTATYILTSLNLPATGIKKGRVYHRPADFLDQLERRHAKNQS